MRKFVQSQRQPLNVFRAAMMSGVSNPMQIEYINSAFKFDSDLTKKYGYITLENSVKKTDQQMNKSGVLFAPENLHKSLMNESTTDLARSFGVLGVSRINFVVNHSSKLYSLSKNVFGNTISNAVIRQTIYKQFLGGESDEDIKLLIDALESKHIGSIVDYAVEADINDEVVGDTYSIDSNNKTISYIKDGKVIYTQQICDEHMSSFDINHDKYKNHIYAFLRSIDIASQTKSMVGFVGIKVSCICEPNQLNKINSYMNNLQSVYYQFTDAEELMDFEGFTKALTKLSINNSLGCSKETLQKHFQNANSNTRKRDNAKLDYYQWMEFLNPKKDPKQLGLNIKPLDTQLMHELNLIRARLNIVCEYCKKKNVRVLIDAEQTYYQDIIHNMTMELITKLNTEQCVVYNTYQAYLKETLRKYLDDLNYAANSKIPFILGAKLVRGAYIEKENELANYFGTESPVCNTYDDTNLSYLRCLVAMVDSIHNNVGAGVIASHNIDSIKFTIDLMDKKNIKLNDDRIIFAQLYGMCSFISNILAENKVHIYKYLPYGPINEVMPYMLRRIAENSSVLQRLGLETTLIKNELVRRMKKTKTNP